MKKRLALIVTIYVVVIGTVLAIVLTRGAGSGAALTTVNVTRGDIVKTVLVDGTLEMPNKEYLSFGTIGKVTKVLVEEGNNVTDGQVLARLDAPSLESSVEMAELQVEIAEQQVDTAQAQYERAKEEWQAPEGWEFLEVVVKSLTGLLGQDEDTAKANLEMAELNLEMAQLNLESAELNLEKAEITAPFDGVVTDVTIAEGRDVTTGGRVQDER